MFVHSNAQSSQRTLKDILGPKMVRIGCGGSITGIFSSIEGTAEIGRRQQSDKFRIGALKLKDAARMFINGCPELHTKDVTLDSFKNVLSQSVKDTHSDQFHFMKLQTAKQRKNESPREFADRCKGLAQKVMRKIDDPVAQRIHRENADCILLSSFVAELGGIGKQVRYASPRDIEQALSKPLRSKKRKIKKNLTKPFTQV